MSKNFAVIGSWSLNDVEKGLTVYRYLPETGELANPVHYDSDVCAGYQCFDRDRSILYIADECESHPGETGGGGFVRAYHVNPDSGVLTFLNETCVLMTKPVYICLDPQGSFLLAACHSGRGAVTKAVHDAKGNWTSAVLYDDAGISLIRIREDGSLGEVCDISLHTGLTKNRKQVHAHPHCVVPCPNGNIFFVCDKGLDRIFIYALDRKEGKLIQISQTVMEYATAPRYSVCHPKLPVLYENNETGNKVYAFQYDIQSGHLRQISAAEAFSPRPGERIMPSDLILHPNGKYLYTGVRGLDQAVQFSIDPNSGAIFKVRAYSLSGAPRGFCISPDGRFLLVAYEQINMVEVYALGEDGSLKETGRRYNAASSANIRII